MFLKLSEIPEPPEGYFKYRFVREFMLERAKAGDLGSVEEEVSRAEDIYDRLIK